MIETIRDKVEPQSYVGSLYGVTVFTSTNKWNLTATPYAIFCVPP